jgi:SNF2 family DNA or RNA helicase
MKLILSPKLIIERCGNVSFKRGDSFYRQNKVQVTYNGSDYVEAVVRGIEDFHVTVSLTSDGKLQAKCSCPRLASINQDCQHVAAVLLALYHHSKGKGPTQQGLESESLSEGFFNLFQDQKRRSTGHQRHFEYRQVIDAQFILHINPSDDGKDQLAMELKLDDRPVTRIHAFLEQVRQGESFLVDSTFIFDPKLHCFTQETDAIIQQLVQVVQDEKGQDEKIRENTKIKLGPHLLLLPPSAWERLRLALTNSKHVMVAFNGETDSGLEIMEEALPLVFDFAESEDDGYLLKIKRLNDMVVLKTYQAVWFQGKLKRLDAQDCERLWELQQMLKASGTHYIPIPPERLRFFQEKVIVGLKRLGRIQISSGHLKRQMQTPLKAKLYLDRLRNRLLAGLEFEYDNHVINPLENRDLPTGTLLMRDEEKEEQILQLMEDAEFAKTDGGYYLQNEELEYRFLTRLLPKLQKRVQVYATTAVRNRISKGVFRPQVRVRVKKERTNWLEFKFEMKGIEDTEIRDLLSALEEKRKYYRLQTGTLLSLETREFDEMRKFLLNPQIQQKDVISGLDLSLANSLQLLDFVQPSSTFHLEGSFKSILENLQNPEQLAFEVPPTLDKVLRDYQKRGFKWMKTLAYYGFGGILADDMGLGKTVQSIAYILSELPTIRETKSPVLIVCPSSLTYNWLYELEKFAPDMKALIVDGNHKDRTKLQKELGDHDVIITSYPLLRQDVKGYEKQSFHTAFFDEAQAFKNPLTQTARAVKRIQASHRFALTGTPLENALEELWSIFHVVFPDLFLGLKEFSQLTNKQITRRISPFMLRRMKKDVLTELPEKIATTEAIDLLPEQKTLYAAYLAKLRHDTLKHLDKETVRKNRIKILAGLTRLRQICCHPGLFVEGYKGSSAKFEQLKQILMESKQSGRRVLIFSQFTKMLNLIGRDLAGQGTDFFYLDGTTPSEERIEMCNRFNEGERDLFLISLKAGGTGLNLMSADTVILYDTWWNPAVEQQATDRAHRMGQKNVVQVIKLVARGTIEEKINDLQEKKRDLINEVITSDEKMEVMLTEEELKEILSI